MKLKFWTAWRAGVGNVFVAAEARPQAWKILGIESRAQWKRELWEPYGPTKVARVRGREKLMARVAALLATATKPGLYVRKDEQLVELPQPATTSAVDACWRE